MFLRSCIEKNLYAYGSKEKGDGTTVTWTGSNVKASDTLNIETGKDTNVIGSKVSGDKVNMNVGGDLNIQSLQDIDNQKYDSSNYGISGSIGFSGSIDGKGGLNVSGSKNKINSEYSSVTDQAGIYAGNRGFDINVGNNTDLKGAVIDSTATSDKNTLITGTITFDDIKNKAEYDSSGNTGFSYMNDDLKNTTVAKGLQGLTPLIGMKVSDEDESTTKSAIAEAKINIMNPDKQKQSITKLDRNTTKILNALSKIFDKKEIEEKQEMSAVFQDVWHTTVGDLVAGGNISKDQQRALNILGGAIAADLAGGSVGGALVGGATVELLQDSFSKITSPALRKVAVAIGAAIAAKGTGQEATAAANVAVAIETFNELTHEQEIKYYNDLANNPEKAKEILRDTVKISDSQAQETTTAFQNDEGLRSSYAKAYNDAIANGETLETYNGYVVSGFDPVSGTYTSFIPVMDSNGKVSIVNTRIFTNAGTDPRVSATVVAGASAVGGALEAATGLGMNNPLGYYLAMDGVANLAGGVGDVSNIWFGTNYNLNFVKEGLKQISPGNGEKVYNYVECVIGVTSAYKNFKNLKAAQGALDTFNTTQIIKQLNDSSRKARKK